MEEELYHINELKLMLRVINPKLEMKTWQKNLSGFTLDVTMELNDKSGLSAIPMQHFKAFDENDRKATQAALYKAYLKMTQG